MKTLHSPGVIPTSAMFEFGGYVPGSDVTAFGTEWTHNQGAGGLPFGPPGYPAVDFADGIQIYAAKNCTVVATNTFKYGSARFVNGVVTPMPVAPVAQYLCTVQLAALFVPPPGGFFTASITDSNGDRFQIPNIDFASLPAPGTFKTFTALTFLQATALPPNELWIIASNASNPPGSFIACSFVGFDPL